MQRHPEWLDGQCVLHVSPEPCFVDDYARRAGTYVKADFTPAYDEIQIDLQNISFPDEVFDLVICHNVIEHIPDDRLALTEIFRVLRPGGIALLSAPMIDAWETTYENPEITAAERDLHFNQCDHYRIYGRDLYARIHTPGFNVTADVAKEPQVHQHGLERGETIFVATKPVGIVRVA